MAICYHRHMSHFSKRLYVVNLLGTLFYLSCLLQWAWAILPYMPGIVEFTKLFHASPEPPVESVQAIPASGPPSMTLLIVACVITAAIIGLTLYVLAKLPTAVAKSGQKITQRASNFIVPAITHHAQLPLKKRQRLTARVIAYLKLTVCIIPIILSACTYFFKTELGYDITMIIAAALGIGTLLLLSAHLLVAKWLKVRSETIW